MKTVKSTANYVEPGSGKEELLPIELRPNVWQLDATRKLTVTTGRTGLKIALHTDAPDGLLRCLMLTAERWRLLVEAIPAIADALHSAVYDTDSQVEFERHIGRNVYVTVSAQYCVVDIRERYLPEGSKLLINTRRGMSLKAKTWKKLKALIPILDERVPGLKEAIPCVYREDHNNQLGYLACSECCPNGEDFIC